MTLLSETAPLCPGKPVSSKHEKLCKLQWQNLALEQACCQQWLEDPSTRGEQVTASPLPLLVSQDYPADERLPRLSGGRRVKIWQKYLEPVHTTRCTCSLQKSTFVDPWDRNEWDSCACNISIMFWLLIRPAYQMFTFYVCMLYTALRVCVCVCVRACVRACVCVCVIRVWSFTRLVS